MKQGETVTGEGNFETKVPQKVSKETKVRQAARTIIESKTLTDEMLVQKKQAILSGARSFV